MPAGSIAHLCVSIMSRAKKISRRKKRASNPTSCQRKAGLPAKRKQRTDQQMIDAMDAVSSGNISSIRNVRCTLDHTKGSRQPKSVLCLLWTL